MSKATGAKSAVAIGTFDGVHIGHQRVLERLNAVAAKEKLERVAYAFVFPPRLTVRGKAQGILLPEEAKIRLLEGYVDRVERASFTDVSQIAPDAFVRQVLLGRLSARAVVVGENFRFGRDRAGDVSLLRSLCERECSSVIAVPPVVIDGSVVSSTRIRKLISQGRVEEAALLLGRLPILLGRVVHGDRLGRKLGFPTANLTIDTRVLLPGDGIYLVHAFWNGQRSPGLLYIGKRPTINESERRCEVYLFGERSNLHEQGPLRTIDLYGKSMEVHIVQKLRDDRHFEKLAQLQQQIGRDVERARGILLTVDSPQEPIFT